MLTSTGKDAKAPATIRQVILSAVCFQGATIVLVWRFVREHGLGWVEAFGLNRFWLRAAVFGMTGMVIFLPVAAILQHFSFNLLERWNINPALQPAVQALQSAGQGWGLAVFALVTVVIAPLGEELLFRGVLYPAIKRAGFPKLAAWGSSTLFAVIHLNLAIFLPLLLLALLLVWLYEQTDNLIAPLAAHAFFNAVNLIVFFVSSDSTARP